MKMIDLLLLAGGNLLRMKTRVAMTAAGVLTGSAAVILLVALGLGLQRNANDSLGKIGDLTQMQVNPPMDYDPYVAFQQQDRKSLGSALTPEVISSFKSIPGVITASPLEYLRASCTLRYKQFEAQPSIQGIDPLQVAELGFHLDSGSLALTPGKVLLGPKAVEFLYDVRKKAPASQSVDWQDAWIDLQITKYPDVVEENGRLVMSDSEPETRRIRVQVAGVLKETGGASDYHIFMALSEVERWNTWLAGKRIDRTVYGYSSALLKVTDVQAASDVDARLIKAGFRVDTPRKMLEEMGKFFRFIQFALGGIGAIALLVSAFGIANTMIMAIYERTREIGLLKSLGATSADVLAVFLIEAGVIGLLGGVAGAAVACSLARVANAGGAIWLNGLVEGMAPPVSIPGAGGEKLFDLPVWLILFAIAFSTLVGMLSGLYPAARAASMDPLTALRHE